MPECQNSPLLEEVLDDFAREPNRSGDMLCRYVANHPRFAEELIDLSHEIFRMGLVRDRTLTLEDRDRIDASFSKLADAVSLKSETPSNGLHRGSTTPKSCSCLFAKRDAC